MDNFKTTGILSKKLIFHVTLSGMRFYHYLYSVICLLYSIYLFSCSVLYAYPLYTALGCLTLLFTAAPWIKAWTNTNLTLKRMAELSSGKSVTIFFEEDGLHCIGVTGNENILPYTAIHIARIRKDYIFIISKAKMYTMVFRSELSPERQTALLEYLRQRNIRIRGKL